jgi:DNA-binding CsgD family transcriptional regulator
MTESEEFGELALVMREIGEAMSASRIAMSIHPSDGEDPRIVHIIHDDPEEFDPERILATASEFVADARDGQHAWRHKPGMPEATILLMPVALIEGHSRLAITVELDAADEEVRKQVETVYLRRRPFAIGYFRLWQLDRIRRRRCAALEAALNLAEIGVLLVARSGDIAFANEAADQVLAANDGLCRVKNALRTANMAEGVRLQVALNHLMALKRTDGVLANEGEAATVLAIHRQNGPPLIISLLATRFPAIEPSDVAAIVFIVDPQLDTARMLEPVCRLYRLSPMETKLVSHLAQGRTLARAAELMRVKEQTARSYMKQIFIKTSTNRQTEMVVLMLSSVVRMRNGLPQEALGPADMFSAGHLMNV